MRKWLNILTLISCLLLSGCGTTTVMLQQMQLGKTNFSAGEFKKAFCQLLPVAVYGCPEAQYAVGYMYYYGFGPARDSESGLFWMRKAAEQHYAPAIKALVLIQRGSSRCEGVREDHSLITCNSESCPPCAAKLNLSDVKPCGIKPCGSCNVQPSNVKPLPVRVKPCASLSSGRHEAIHVVEPPRLSQKTTDDYALQLYGAYQLKHVKNLQNELNVAAKTRIWHTKNRSRDWYVLTVGSFSSIADARLARDELPSRLSDLEPWVRNLNQLEKV